MGSRAFERYPGIGERPSSPARSNVSAKLETHVFLTAASVVAIVLVAVVTGLVVVVVIGLHVWGAIQDGREEKAMRAWRRSKR
jgi:hypothetical protein